MMFRLTLGRLWLRSKLGERGAAMTEYALILAFVGVIAVTALFAGQDSALGGAIKKVFENVKNIVDAKGGEVQLKK